MRPNCPVWPNAPKVVAKHRTPPRVYVFQCYERIGEHGPRRVAVSGDHEIETDRRVAVSARLESLRMERRAQHADERAYGGSDKAHDSFPVQWVLTNVRRWAQREKATHSLEDTIKKYQQRR